MADNLAAPKVLDATPVHADGCFEHGMMYSIGREVAIDMVEAHKWFNIAALRGNKDAIRLRREVAEQMSDSEIGAAQRAARDWLEQNLRTTLAAPEFRAAA